MKLTLSQGELMSIINAKFNTDLKFSELVIENSSVFGNIFEKALRDTLSIYGSGMICFPDKKIAAIKHLRELLREVDCGRRLSNGAKEFGMGLLQSKIAVEQPMSAIHYAHQFNEPKSTY
jgi:hypothetical protein